MQISQSQRSNVSPAELIACLDACPQGAVNPWFAMINDSLQQHRLTWRAVGVALQMQMEQAFNNRSAFPCDPTGSALLEQEGGNG